VNPSAIFSKTGKGVQEASGKTSHLSRGDRAVLAAIDGKTSLGEVQKKFEKLAGPKFEALIQQLDKDGFIREVSSGAPGPSAAAPASRAPAARGSAPAARAAPPSGGDGEELDFTQAISLPPKAPPPKGPQVDLAAAARAEAERKAKEQQAFDYKARQEAEAKAKAQADAKAKAEAEARARAKAEAEAKARAEAEAKARADSEARARAETEAKVKAAREAAVRLAAEAKAKADAEAKAAAELKSKLEEERKAREDAERRAREAGEQARKEAEEKAKRDAEELRQRLEAEMKAKLEEERKAREAEDRKRREEEDQRRAREEAERRAREEEERKRREEEDRKRREEEERRRKEEEERRAREEAERRAREEERKRREEEDRKRREEDERRRKEEEERRAKEEQERKAREERERKEREERDRREREDRERREKEAAEAKAREEREKKEREDRERKEKEEAERKARDDRERREREESEAKAREERERQEREDRERREKEEPAAKAKPAAGGGFDDSLLADLDSFTKRDEDEQREKEAAERKAKQEAERRAKEEAEREAREAEEKKRREDEEKKRREAEEKRAREAEERREREEEERREREEEERREHEKEEAERKREAKEAERRSAEKAARRPAAGDDVEVGDEDLDMDDVKRDEKALSGETRRAAREREEQRSLATVKAGRPKKWGKPVAIGLFVLLLAALGVLQVTPLSTAEYEKAASEAFGAPVKIASAHLSLLTGVELKLDRVAVGDGLKIGLVRASPEIGSLFGAKKAFSKVELEDVTLTQGQLGAALFGRLGGDDLRIARVVAKKLKLDGPLPLPPLDADAVISGDGTLQSLTLQGGDKMVVRIAPRGGELGFDIAAGGFTVPFVPALTLTDFNMKGSATRDGVTQSEFDGRIYEGVLAGTMRVRWGPTWTVEGELKPRALSAAVFAPALVSEGKVDGRAAYSMSGTAPASLFESARIQGDFKIEQGVLGSFDISKAMQTGGSQTQGRTVFTEMSGQGVYDKGTVEIRNVSITAGAMNVGASLDIAPGGALAGRIAADIKTPAQTVRGVFAISGSKQDPVIRK